MEGSNYMKKTSRNEPVRVRIKNYQILKDVKFEFVNGLNVILGPSNNGKSSVIRAMEAALFHKSGGDFIRSGTEAAQVAISMNGNKLAWFKPEGSGGGYNLNGQEYTKVGRISPPEVQDATEIKEVIIMDTKERINFWRQMEYPFLLNKTPSQLFAFLAFSAEQDQLTSVFQSIKEDTKAIERNIVLDEGRIDSTKTLQVNLVEELSKLEELQETINDIISLDGTVSNYNRLNMFFRRYIYLMKTKPVFSQH